MKRLFLIACVICVIFSLSACGGKETQPEPGELSKDEYIAIAVEPPHRDSLWNSPDKYKDEIYRLTGTVEEFEIVEPDSSLTEHKIKVRIVGGTWEVLFWDFEGMNDFEYDVKDTVTFYGTFRGNHHETRNPELFAIYAELTERYAEDTSDIVYVDAAAVFNGDVPEGYRARVVTDEWMIYKDSLVLTGDHSGMVYVVISPGSPLKLRDLVKGDAITVTGKIGSLLNMDTDRYFNNAVIEIATDEHKAAAQQ